MFFLFMQLYLPITCVSVINEAPISYYRKTNCNQSATHWRSSSTNSRCQERPVQCTPKKLVLFPSRWCKSHFSVNPKQTYWVNESVMLCYQVTYMLIFSIFILLLFFYYYIEIIFRDRGQHDTLCIFWCCHL